MAGNRNGSRLDIPTAPRALDRDWLTSALREGGVLREARVTSVEHEVLG